MDNVTKKTLRINKDVDERKVVNSGAQGKTLSGAKTLVINGVPETFKNFEEFRAKIMSIKETSLERGDKHLVVNNLTTNNTVKPSSTWEELHDGDRISITALGSGAAI